MCNLRVLKVQIAKIPPNSPCRLFFNHPRASPLPPKISPPSRQNLGANSSRQIPSPLPNK